jgi:hypothetical protein
MRMSNLGGMLAERSSAVSSPSFGEVPVVYKQVSLGFLQRPLHGKWLCWQHLRRAMHHCTLVVPAAALWVRTAYLIYCWHALCGVQWHPEVSVLFADISSYTAMSTQVEPEQVRAAAQQWVEV